MLYWLTRGFIFRKANHAGSKAAKSNDALMK